MTTAEIFAAVKAGTMTDQQATQLLEAQANEAVKTALKRNVTLKVSNKGCIQIDGLRARFPISFYVNEYEVIDGMRDEIHAFIAANKSRLAKKGE